MRDRAVRVVTVFRRDRAHAPDRAGRLTRRLAADDDAWDVRSASRSKRARRFTVTRATPTGVTLAAFGIALFGCGDGGGSPGATHDTTAAADGDGSASGGATMVADVTGATGTDGTLDSNTGDSGGSTTGDPPPAWPEPGDWPPNAGPGGPAVTFAPEDLDVACAFLAGGPTDVDHHNLVQMYDGYLLLPWAPEWAGGGISFFDVSDPCNPVEVGMGESLRMRESHAIGFAEIGARRFAVVAHKEPGLLASPGGIQFWDITDPTTPFEASNLKLDGHAYPDAYARVTLSQFWQVPYVYVAASENGIFVVDAADPMNPELVAEYDIEPTMRAGQVQVIGNLLVVSAAEGPRTVLLDVSVPDFPQPIAGGDFEIVDGAGMTREGYFANMEGSLVWFAVKNGGGGLLAYDIADPSAPVYAGHLDSGGNGGYVFVKDDVAFVGESTFAGLYDVSDPAAITQLRTLSLTGDLDTITPIGNVAVLSVDDGADPGQGTSIVPWTTEVDTVAPRVTWSVPADGAVDLPVTSRIGVTWSEFVDPRSAWAGSVRLWRAGPGGEPIPVQGTASAQETIVNFCPKEALLPGTEYTFEIPAGGVVDYNGNAVDEPFSITFTTRDG
jgi:hypothetical protein